MDRGQFERLDERLAVIRTLFEEVPHLRLTRPQFKRLWHLDDVRADALLSALVASGYLVETCDHQIVRALTSCGDAGAVRGREASGRRCG